MKIVLIIGLSIILIFFAAQVHRLWAQHGELRTEVSNISGEVEMAKKENKSLNDELAYYANPENLLKEFKKLFNYKAPHEKLYIVVPKENHQP